MTDRVLLTLYSHMRNGCYAQAYATCDAMVRSHSANNTVAFWRVACMGLRGEVSGALKMLEDGSVPRGQDIQLPCLKAQAHFYGVEASVMVSSKDLQDIHEAVQMASSEPMPRAALSAAYFSFFAGNYDEAFEVVNGLVPNNRSVRWWEGGNSDGGGRRAMRSADGGTLTPDSPLFYEAIALKYWLACTDWAVSDDLNGQELLREVRRAVDEYRRSASAAGGGASSSSGGRGGSMRAGGSGDGFVRVPSRELELSLAFAKCLEMAGAFKEALDVLHGLVGQLHDAGNSGGGPDAEALWTALTERAKLFARSGDWAQAMIDVENVMRVNDTHFQSLRIHAVHELTQVATDPSDRLRAVEPLRRQLLRLEDANAVAVYRTARLISRVCAQDDGVLREVLGLLEHARQCASGVSTRLGVSQAAILSLQGDVHTALGEYDTALNAYAAPSQFGEVPLDAMEGQLLAQALAGDYAAAEQQLDLVSMSHDNVDQSGGLALVRGMIAWHLHSDRAQHVNEITTFANVVASTTGGKLAEAWLKQSSPATPMVLLMDGLQAIGEERLDHLVLAGKELLEHVRGHSGKDMKEALERGVEVLDFVISRSPTTLVASTTVAQALFEAGYPDKAVNRLRECVDRARSYMPGYLLLADMALRADLVEEAEARLEEATSSDFTVRNWPLYQLLLAKVRAAQGQIGAALDELERAMSAPGVRQTSSSSASSTGVGADSNAIGERGGLRGNSRPRGGAAASAADAAAVARAHPLEDRDKVALFAEYARMLARAGRLTEAQSVLVEAQAQFKDTPLYVEVLVVASDLAVRKRNYEKAVKILNKISQDSPAYLQAQLTKASILLQHQRDRTAYIKCFEDLRDADPESASSYTHLGEAYMRIQAPDEAVAAFEQAYQRDPSNVKLATRLGEALVATHSYHRAIQFYEEELREHPEYHVLRRDLARLYAKLSRHQAAARLLQQSVNPRNQDDSVQGLKERVDTLTLLAQVYRQSGMESASRDAADALQQAVDVQRQVVDACRSDGRERVAAERTELASLLTTLGKELATQGTEGLDRAADAFSRALDANESHHMARVALAQIHFRRNEYDQCLKQCDRVKQIATATLPDLHKMTHTVTQQQENNAHASSSSPSRPQQPAQPQQQGAGDTAQEEKGSGAGSGSMNRSSRRRGRRVRATAADDPAAGSADENRMGNSEDAAGGEGDGTTDASTARASRALRAEQEVLREALREALVLSSEVHFLKSEYDQAAEHLRGLLRHRPGDYDALSRMTSLLRRSGQLEEARTHIKNAEEADARSILHAGLHYCKGLFARYTNDVHTAAMEFNLARQDGPFRADALAHMVDIYLEPDADAVWEAASNTEDAGDVSTAPPQMSIDSQQVLSSLLEEARKVLPQDSLRLQLMECKVMLASRQEDGHQTGMKKLISILEENRDYVPALLAMAHGFVLESQLPKARNVLKRIATLPYQQELADQFERSYLLLAQFHVRKNKYDLAEDLCRRCLTFNQSSGPAWEILGLVKEKELAFRDAAECYEKAWSLMYEASASLGYKLAFNYLKAERYVETVNVCAKVIKQFPDYPAIRDQILNVAMQSLRA